MPVSSVITFAPTNAAMSYSTSLSLGALIASVLNDPFRRFSTSRLSASPSTSSAISTKSFLPLCAIISSSGTNSCADETFLSVTTTAGLSYTASMRFGSVTIYGLINPRCTVKPSTTSLSNSRPRPSSTVTIPFGPILSITSAISAPIASSPAEIVATSATRFLSPLMSSDNLVSSLVTSTAARSSPLRNSIGLCPAAISLFASCRI